MQFETNNRMPERNWQVKNEKFSEYALRQN